MHGESRRQSRRQSPGQVHDFVGNFSRILSQSWRNGIWALADWQGGELLETLQSDTGLTGNYYRYYHYNNN